MARIRNASIRKTRRKNLFKRSKGFRAARRNTFRQAHQAVMKAEAYAYRGRKERKRQFRRLWITRINAGLGPHGLSYSKFMHGVNKASIGLDRKSLANLALHDAAAFKAVVDAARAHL